MKSISTLCSFYLSSNYKKEKEYRIVHKVYCQDSRKNISLNEKIYLEIPLGEMSAYGYKIEIIDVFANNKLDTEKPHNFTLRELSM